MLNSVSIKVDKGLDKGIGANLLCDHLFFYFLNYSRTFSLSCIFTIYSKRGSILIQSKIRYGSG